jgi:hypothetical protein
MSCLDITTKIAMMIDQILTAKRMLKRDDIRPDVRQWVEEELSIWREDVKELYVELFKIMRD